MGPSLLPGLAKMQRIHLRLPLSSCLPPPGIRNLRLISFHVLKCHCSFHLPEFFTFTTFGREAPWEQLLSPTNAGMKGQGQDLPSTFYCFPGRRGGSPSLPFPIPHSEPYSEEANHEPRAFSWRNCSVAHSCVFIANSHLQNSSHSRSSWNQDLMVDLLYNFN